MAPTPKWVEKITEKVWAEHGRGEPPNVVWRESKTKNGASGHCLYSGRRIVVTMGVTNYWDGTSIKTKVTKADVLDAKITLLHELAHALTPHHNHDATFYKMMAMLCRENGVKKTETLDHGKSRGYYRSMRRGWLDTMPSKTATPA